MVEYSSESLSHYFLFLQYSDDTPVSGSTMFGFHTPKRRGALAEAGKLS